MTEPQLLEADEQLTGEVLGVVYADTDGGFGVIELDRHGDAGGARCSGPLAGLTQGQTVTLVGRWRVHERYGPTFEAVYYEQVTPTTVAGLRSFLASARFAEVPQAARTRAITAFGRTTGQVIEQQPERLVDEAGLDPEHAELLRRIWLSGRALAEMIRIVEPVRWPMRAVRAAHARFAAETPAIARERPYDLLDADGVPFSHVDALALHLGVAPTSPDRLAAAARAAVVSARRRGGHQHLPRSTCVDATANLLSVDRLLAADGVEAAIARGTLGVETLAGDEVVSTPEALAAERSLADGLRRLAKGTGRLVPHAGSVTLAAELTDGQRAAVRAAFEHPVSVLTGGPGTGKTRTVQELVHNTLAAGLQVALCAPTGRAAKRLEELVGRSATTIHRLLEARPSAGGFTFRFGRDEQLPMDLVVVDEVSMCDTWLADRLVRAVEDGAHLVLVGDADQLPSVGPGDVLRDVIRSGAVPVTALTEIHRQAVGSRIVALAREVLAGEVGPLRGVDGDVFVAEEPRRGAVVARVVQAVAERAPDYFGVTHDDVQVLAPVYRGPTGVDALNAALKEALNPAADRAAVGGFHAGDRVLQTRNDAALEVANGDVGRVVDLSVREGTLRVAFPRGEVTYGRRHLADLVPAWALTVHKAQGGEWPVIVLVLDRAHRSMLWRNLVYTAITRAQRALIVVGRSGVLHEAARHDRPSTRHTGLGWRLSSPADAGAEAPLRADEGEVSSRRRGA